MRRRLATRWVVMLLALPLTSCFTVRHAYDGDKFLTSDAEVPGLQLTKVKHFERHDRQFFWLHGGVPVGEDLNGAALAAREAWLYDGVVNLRIADGQSLLDMAVTHVACVLSLLCGSWSVWVEGDVVDVVEPLAREETSW